MKLKSSSAFSLIEVLIAVAIFSSVIVFVFRSFAASLSGARLSQRITLASFLVEAKSWEIEQAYKKAHLELSGWGIEKIQNTDFHWQYEIHDTESDELKELILSVSWKEKYREKEYQMDFSTYLAKESKE